MRLKNLLFLIRHRRFNDIAWKIGRRLYSDSTSYCLRRDLSVSFPAPAPRIPITVRSLRQDDVSRIFRFDAEGMSNDERREIVSRLQHVKSGIPTCYVAVTDGDTPAYIQWLMGPKDNDRIQRYFNGIFPVLGPDEALLENAFTLSGFRGKGVMASAMSAIAEKAAGIGARWVLTFVEKSNIPSLKGCKRAGFHPYTIRHDRWILFFRKLSFTRLPENTPYPFDDGNRVQGQQRI